MLIGLSGKAGAGKDTLGAALVDDFGFQRVAFADALKDALKAADPWVHWYDGFHRLSHIVATRGWEKAKANPAIRGALQDFGMALRAQDEFVWCRIGMARSDAICQRGGDVVITDVRFANEARAIRKRGGLVVRIERDGHESADAHVSETALDGWSFDLVIRNHVGYTDPTCLAALLLAEIRESAA